MKMIIQCGVALILIASSLATRAAAGDVIADCNAIADPITHRYLTLLAR